MILALLKNAISGDGRQDSRYDLKEPCVVERWGRSYPASTLNISRGGLSIDVVGMGSAAFDAELTVHLRDYVPITAKVIWSHRRTFGLQFLAPIDDHPDFAALIEELAAGR